MWRLTVAMPTTTMCKLITTLMDDGDDVSKRMILVNTDVWLFYEFNLLKWLILHYVHFCGPTKYYVRQTEKSAANMFAELTFCRQALGLFIVKKMQWYAHMFLFLYAFACATSFFLCDYTFPESFGYNYTHGLCHFCRCVFVTIFTYFSNIWNMSCD